MVTIFICTLGAKKSKNWPGYHVSQFRRFTTNTHLLFIISFTFITSVIHEAEDMTAFGWTSYLKYEENIWSVWFFSVFYSNMIFILFYTLEYWYYELRIVSNYAEKHLVFPPVNCFGNIFGVYTFYAQECFYLSHNIIKSCLFFMMSWHCCLCTHVKAENVPVPAIEMAPQIKTAQVER